MKTTIPHFRIGFMAGLAAGAIATGLMLIINTTMGGISLPEVFGSALTALMPPAMFDYLHRTIGGDAKHYLFYIILVGQCLVFALSGGGFYLAFSKWSAASARPQLQWYQGLLLGFILWLLTGLLLLPLTGAGIFGAQLNIGLISSMLSLAVTGLVFGVLFVYFQHWLVDIHQNNNRTSPSAEASASKATLKRRALLRTGAIWLGVGVLGYFAWRFISQGGTNANVAVSSLVKQFKSKIIPPPVPNYGEIHPAPFLSPEVTSNDQYYIVSKNLFNDPVVDGQKWQLVVNGEVDHPFTLNYQQLLALPTQQQYESMMCISNEVGGQYMSNAQWEGVPLMDLLQRAGVKSNATKVVFYAEDDYSDSIHLTKALEPTTLLAIKMNGATLPQGHGFPARMLVPGIYGMKHVKWINRIQVVQDDYQGYWQQRGWSDPAPIRLTSRIDTPLTGSSVASRKTTYVAGVAFSGNKGISEVDLSFDEGNSWQRATLKQPFSDLTWVLWEFAWQPAPGNYTIIVRAIDSEGNVQNPNVEPPIPNGSSGYHQIDISVN